MLPAARLSRFLGALVFAALLPLTAANAVAGEAAGITRQIAESGNFAEGEKRLAARLAADPADDETRFGLAMVKFIAAVEAFGNHHYRHGLKAPSVPMVPFLRMPVPDNPDPEPLSYETQRTAFANFLARLADVEATLAGMKAKDEVKIVIDLEKVRLDFTGRAKGDASATLMRVVRSIMQARPLPPLPGAAPEVFEVAFDRADAIWLRGYCHLLSAGLEFVLAHDWSPTFLAAGDLFYPRIAGNGAAKRPSTTAGESALPWARGGTGDIAAAIAMIHLIRWEPVEPKRMASVRLHLKQVVALSRENWAAIMAETDDDREWIPSPNQKNGVLPNMGITEERVRTWLAALDEFDEVLDGKKLVPHWGLDKGINLKRVFEEPRTFDLVLWATGHGVGPYLENGPMITSQSWLLWQRVFQGNFLGFAVYFN